MATIIPISSAIAAKIISFATNGIVSGLPCVRPTPNQPPAAIENKEYAI